jgi:hypothetical protein
VFLVCRTYDAYEANQQYTFQSSGKMSVSCLGAHPQIHPPIKIAETLPIAVFLLPFFGTFCHYHISD